MEKPIYLDYNATTPMDPRVFKAMEPYFVEHFGNASSRSHAYGWKAEQAVEEARKAVAQLLQAKPSEVFWTSGATESNNLAILGVLRHHLCHGQTPHLITSAIEHKAVLEVCQLAEELGAELTVLPVDQNGLISLETLKASIKPNTALISIMMGNNEIGTIQPVQSIGELAHAHNILYHCDAAQSFGKSPIDVNTMHIDLLSISGHKIYGPKGVGALYVRKGIELKNWICGGDQEKGLRPGTLNVPGIVGLGECARLCAKEMIEESKKLTQMRDDFIQKILSLAGSEVRLNGHPTQRLCNNVSFSFLHLNSDMFALGLSGLALSSGSACTSGSAKPSHVLKALGLEDSVARATLRVGIGRFTTPEDLDEARQKILGLIKKNKAISVV